MLTIINSFFTDFLAILANRFPKKGKFLAQQLFDLAESRHGPLMGKVLRGGPDDAALLEMPLPGFTAAPIPVPPRNCQHEVGIHHPKHPGDDSELACDFG